jgi:hypothetical protein
MHFTWRKIFTLASMAMLTFTVVHVQAQVISTSRFFLMVEDPCETQDQQGPTWCEKALFRLVSKTDCHEFKPKGRSVIHYCVDGTERTPCQDLGVEFEFQGLRYRVDTNQNVWATNQRGEEVWREIAAFIHTKSPNPSFQWTGNTCVLPASEFER